MTTVGQMPIALKIAGICPNNCPCADLPTWPQLELPLPRSPQNVESKIISLRSRLNKLTWPD